MRVLYVLSENLNRAGGGIVHFLAVARGLQRLGHDVTIMGPQYGLAMNRRPDLRGIYVPVLFRSVATFLVFQVLAAALFPFVWLLHRPDVVLVRGCPGVFWLMHIAARLLGVRVVVEVNGIPWAEMASRGFSRLQAALGRAMYRLLCRTAHAIITVTPGIGRELARAFGLAGARVFPIQNGADPDEFDPTRREQARAAMDVPADALVVGFVGLFTPWQGVEELIESIDHLPEDAHERVVYIMAGTGQLWGRLQTIVRQRGLESHVRLPGRVPRGEIPTYYAAFDLGVRINTDEHIGRFGFSSLKFWEYLAAGLPVLVSDDENLAPLVERWQLGWVLRDVSPASIAAAVAEAYRRRGDLAEIGRRNRALVQERFSWTAVSRQVAAVLAGDAGAVPNLAEVALEREPDGAGETGP